ncbi:hypothetical protein KC19_3G010800 [Ceratodon purpureus]|uniref:Uncharacterized protein n=1 Tax=Ceratodon purpureus TaxID=3225 RepID=A0A8T0IDJ3_CERPU|nr:hypothetical protein KC19_3G010800 [Ceratodon purpureus]
MGSTVKGTIFKEETISDIHKWHEKATQKSKSHPRQRPVSHRLAGIIGLNKEKDAEGNVRDFELLDHHNHGNGHGQPHAPPHGHHPQHPHQQPHAHPGNLINQPYYFSSCLSSCFQIFKCDFSKMTQIFQFYVIHFVCFQFSARNTFRF